jgi:phosphoglycolate phosphatase
LALRLALFDLDGVLLDSRANMETAWKAVQEKHAPGVPFADYFSLIGRPFREIMARLDLSHCASQAESTYHRASLDNAHLLRWYDDVPEMLAQTVSQGIKIGIVTSKDTERTRAIARMLAVTFSTIQTPNGVYRGKPAPDHLLVACAEANVDPAEACYVGDMSVDLEAARRAGLAFVHARWGYGETPVEGCAIAENAVHLLAIFNERPPT